MQYFEIFLSFIIGALLILTIGFVLSLKTKGFFRLALNSIVGAIALLLFNIFNVASMPLNPLNALIIGGLGIPGLIVVYLLVLIL